MWSGETASLCGVSAPSSRQCWADFEDEDNDEWQSMWAPPSQPEMRELSIVSLPPSKPSAEATITASKAERREFATASAKAKRTVLIDAVLEGLLRQAQAPYLYHE